MLHSGGPQPSLMFVDKAWSIPYDGAPEVLYLGRLQPYLQTLDWERKACQGQTLEVVRAKNYELYLVL